MDYSLDLIVGAAYLVSGSFIFFLGLTILRMGGSGPGTRSTALILFFCGIGPILSAVNIVMMNTLKEGAVVYKSMVENFEYLWEFYFPAILLFALTFPRQNRFIEKHGYVAFLIFLPHIMHLVVIMLAGGPSQLLGGFYSHVSAHPSLTGEKSKLAFAGLSNLMSILASLVVKLHRELFSLVNIVFAAFGLGIIARKRRGILAPRAARQARTVLSGLSASTMIYAFAKVAPLASGRSLPAHFDLPLTDASLLAGGGAVAFAVVRQDLLGIRFVVRKMVLYGAAALAFALLYLIVVKPIGSFFGSYSSSGKRALETGFVILTIISFQPVLIKMEETLERIILRGRENVIGMFESLGASLIGATDMAQLEDILRRGLAEIMGVGSVNLRFFDTVLDDSGPAERLRAFLAEISGPVRTAELQKMKRKASKRALRRKKHPASGERDAGELAFLEPELVENFALIVPLFKEGTCVGYLALGEKGYGTRFTAEELSLLPVLAGEITVARENIRLLRESVEKEVMEEELKLARAIQARLLPDEPLTIPGYELHALTVPSRYVGGDYYDFTLIDGNKLIVTVADVSGKGVPAALLVATLHAAVRSNEDVQRRPKEMISRINNLLFTSTAPEQFATLFYAVIDLETGELRYCNAGHDYPIMTNGTGVDRLNKGGMVLGCVSEYPYEEHVESMPGGANLVLFTDGLTEAPSGEEFFGEDRLVELVGRHADHPASSLCRIMIDEVKAFSQESDVQDDLTVLVLKRCKRPAGER